MVEGHIRPLEQGLEIIPIPWADSDPNTAGNAALSGQFLQYPVKAFQDTPCHHLHLLVPQNPLEKSHELIPANPRHDIAASEQTGKLGRYLCQHRIPKHMAILVIDHLKIVDINDKQGCSLRFFPVSQQIFDPLSGGSFVVQPGKGIPLRACLQLLGCHLFFIDINYDPDCLAGLSLVVKLCGCPQFAPLVTPPGIRNLKFQFPVPSA